MEKFINPEPELWSSMLIRPTADDSVVRERVQGIIAQVRLDGDAALRSLALELDGAQIDSLAVTPREIEQAIALTAPELRHAIESAANNIRKFHEAQRQDPIQVSPAEGVECSMRSVPITRVGLYIPGGSAPLFSTVLMLGIPAQIAGCREVILCTPPNRQGGIDPAILFAANVCGISKIYKCGGAGAIAAMAYGTESIPCVFKIFGPGNQYVTMAKQMVSLDRVAIDMPAGPSEVLVMADSTAVPAFVAADLLSQAEHGADSQVILVTNCAGLVPQIEQELEQQLGSLPRATTARRALENSRIFVMNTPDQMVDLVNLYAPEHLIIAMANPEQIAHGIESAGSIFLGNYTPESVGDYASGTNHTLPTGGWAASYSGVCLDSFQKKIMTQRLTPQGLQNIGPIVETMATAEGLDAHRAAISIRLAQINTKK